MQVLCIQICTKIVNTTKIFVVCRLQEAAEFACYADLQDEQDIAWHFSLKLPIYVQFTSPIRRFMDIIIHRFVAAALDNEPDPYTAEEVGVLFTVYIYVFSVL